MTAARDFPFPGDWMTIDGVGAAAGRWARLDYAVALYARLERPTILWRGAAGEEEISLGAAPSFGKGEWIGRVPRFARTGWCCVGRDGPAPARLGALRPMGAAALLARAFVRRPGLAWLAARAAVAGQTSVADRRLLAACAALPLGAARRWSGLRRRAAEPNGLDRPSAARAPRLRVVVLEEAPWIAALDRSRGGVEIMRVDTQTPFAALTDGLADDDLIAVAAPGDAFAPEAPDLARAVAASCDADLIYADEAVLSGAALRLKPDWSPILAESLDLIGRAWFARAHWARARMGARPVGALEPLRPAPGDRIHHLRRVLLTTPAPAPVASPRAVRLSSSPAASLIIPSAGDAELMSACLASLPASPDLDIVVIDNGPENSPGAAFLAACPDPRLRVLRDRGPFNFSRLCNAGAAAARAPTLVFLNDDVEARDSDWIALMTHWARRPDVGAVGAKLLYPDGRLQHGGVILGMGGRAGHFERFAAADEPGYFGRLGTPHEISAVTGACLAVEAAKFAAVGGFDERNLPVDLNDVDLCLRLAERGWRCVMEPRARLIHHESASRGDHIRGELRYAAEIAWFRRRWARELGDDPYFHPALSLHSTAPALA